MTNGDPAGGGNFADIEILEEGIRLLCENDAEAEKIIAPRYAEIIPRLCRYIAEIELRNPSHSLVGTDSRRELIKRHILDSLAPLGIFDRLLKEKSRDTIPRIADVGSGAGLPGIPLAIALPETNFTLIERMGRRADFLRHAREALELSNVTIIEDELEKFAHNMIVKNRAAGENFALVTFRAFRPFEPKIVKGLFRLCSGGGTIAAYKGRRVKIEEEISTLENYLASAAGKSKTQIAGYEIIPCPVPLLDEERHILLIRLQERAGN